jgi:hypothetical protein
VTDEDVLVKELIGAISARLSIEAKEPSDELVARILASMLAAHYRFSLSPSGGSRTRGRYFHRVRIIQEVCAALEKADLEDKEP